MPKEKKVHLINGNDEIMCGLPWPLVVDAKLPTTPRFKEATCSLCREKTSPVYRALMEAK